ncbi:MULTISPECIES: hypothetical protein [unclassified Streptomyces]|uniref:hypothetical protein n=1 Tax=unclassified Streptomyces TaxID=2593676 RepID=UPI0001C19424|nr:MULTISPECIES: hypothetical protein [unclassified Streptomyces]AEN10802.1 conserved hypothetical protein [Streptomyces sp. SirexAA-E]MYR69206.1 hypothetical protein [Streptomyces sp. SID4939]MYS00362.1 hypothetical protein [Streptomyces sp. SID4940]MYT63929.1 hypothetical protein [Streptomyces sp. SID8357]MYT86179.1 hypothetical protein [Streptomyces sp. SID8360]
MTDTSSSDALALRATASGFDAVRGKLPVAGDPDHPLDNVAVALQLSNLGSLLTELADEVLHRAAEQRREGHTASAIMGFAAAVRPACEAASALGAVARRLSARDQAGHLDDGAADDGYDQLVMGNALGIADKALRETSEGLRAAAETISPSSARVEAARSRSTTAVPSPTPPASAVPSAAPPGRTVRGR